MNKKIFIPLIGITLALVGAAYLGTARSEEGLPYNLDSPKSDPPLCHQAFLNEMALMRGAWENHINQLTSQEKPASEMVDEAFQATRTYRCWLEYLCRTVQYSGMGSAEETAAGVLEGHVGRIPGCAAPEDIVIPNTQLKFIDQCHVKDGGSMTVEEVQLNNTNACMRYVELNFGTPESDTPSAAMLKNLQNQSTVYIALEKKLKGVNSSQRARALETKLFEIVNKMSGMEAQAQYLKNFLNQLKSLLPCYVGQCD
ncbi:MAG: hypothetical protein V1908_00420 [Candidatus Peregrinibacteria bacterium]